MFQDGKVTGNGGCNDYEADYVVDGDYRDHLEYPGQRNRRVYGQRRFQPGGAVVLRFAGGYVETYDALVTSMIFSDGEGNPQVFFGTP